MKRLVLLLLLAAIAWHGYGRYQQSRAVRATNVEPQPVAQQLPHAGPTRRNAEEPTPTISFKCDGRIVSRGLAWYIA